MPPPADHNLAVAAQVLGGLSLARQADVCAGLKPVTLRHLLPLLLISGTVCVSNCPTVLQQVEAYPA